MKHIIAILLVLVSVPLLYSEERQLFPNRVGWEWVKKNPSDEYWLLYVHGVRQGAYYPNLPETANYLPIINGYWALNKIACPFLKPNVDQMIANVPPGGVDPSKLSDDRITINGREVPAMVWKQLSPGTLTDDSNKPHITYISGDAAKRSAMEQLWETDPRLKPYRDTCHFMALPLTTPKGPHHRARLYRLDIDKRFKGEVFLVQGPEEADGKSQPVPIYEYTPEKLPDRLSEALSEIDPKYDPNKLKTPGGGNLGIKTWVYEKIAQLKTWIMANIEIVVIVGGLIWFFNRKK